MTQQDQDMQLASQPIREITDYNPGRYQVRTLMLDMDAKPITEDDLIMWLTAGGEVISPLRLIVGEPGSGKTWLINRMREELRGAGQAIFTLDAVAVLGETADEGSEAEWEKALHIWLDGAPHRPVLENVKLYSDQDVPFRYLFGTLVKRVCEGYGGYRPPAVLLVDRLDELTDTAQKYCENHVLEPFLASLPAACARALVAARTSGIFQSPWLSWAAESLTFSLPVEAGEKLPDGNATILPASAGTVADADTSIPLRELLGENMLLNGLLKEAAGANNEITGDAVAEVVRNYLDWLQHDDPQPDTPGTRADANQLVIMLGGLAQPDAQQWTTARLRALPQIAQIAGASAEWYQPLVFEGVLRLDDSLPAHYQLSSHLARLLPRPQVQQAIHKLSASMSRGQQSANALPPNHLSGLK